MRARRRVDLRHSVAVQISDLDLVNERVLLPVDLGNLPAVAVGMHQGHDTLVVGGHRESRPAVLQDQNLGFAHAAELSAEVLLPQCLGDEPLRSLAPQLERRFRTAQGEDAGPPDTGIEDHGLVKHVTVGILERDHLPRTLSRHQDLE